MPTCIVMWGTDGQARVASPAELDALLRKLAARHPGEDAILVEIARPGSGSLSVGVGRELSVLSHVPEDGLPPYRLSWGGGVDRAETFFYYQGVWTPFDGADLVEAERARAAARRFVETGELSGALRWREV